LWVAARFIPGSFGERIRQFYFPVAPISVEDGVSAIPMLVPKAEILKKTASGNFRLLLGGAPGAQGTMNMCWEQLPHPDNFIALDESAAPDLLGMPRIKVKASLTEDDRRTVRNMLEISCATLQELKIAHSFVLPEEIGRASSEDQLGRVTPGNHPTGVTRMSPSAATGVVDRDLCLHGFDNCHVLSTGVFPRAGYANPVLTLMALGIRLADHVQELQGS
jgi:choline dehydrogenase-like flavoprotein